MAQLREVARDRAARLIDASMRAYGFWLLFLLALGGRLWFVWEAPPYSPDSWSYWELAQSVGHDFYRIQTWRQFQFAEPYGVSFPPLWPIAIALVDAITQLGYRSGLALNVVLAVVTAAVLQRFCARFIGHGNVGLIIATALIAHRSYFEELAAGRSMPLSLLLLLLLLWQLLAASAHVQRETPQRALMRIAAIAVTAALATLNRFDFLPALLVLGIAAPLLLTRAKLGSIALWGAVAGATLAPWIAYCYSHFGRVFVSDNSRTVLSAIPVYVDDFFATAPPTLFDAPMQWLAKTVAGAYASATSLAQPFAVNLLLLLFAALLLLQLRDRSQKSAAITDTLRNGWLLGDLAVAAQLSSVLLTGFTSVRYALPLEFYLTLRTAYLARVSIGYRSIIALTTVVALQFALLHVPALRVWLNPVVTQAPHAEFDSLARCLVQTPNARVLFLTDSNERAYRFGAQYRIETLGTPHNYRVAELDVLIQRFGATHIYDTLPEPLAGGLSQRVHATLLPACGRSDVFEIATTHLRSP